MPILWATRFAFFSNAWPQTVYTLYNVRPGDRVNPLKLRAQLFSDSRSSDLLTRAVPVGGLKIISAAELEGEGMLN
ncbi:hypothetical protein C8R46DRAFT_1136065 [Mycena filopes]|nr:hypothetical protein C8R46DRAFT_1136065 [Mycena filopes]